MLTSATCTTSSHRPMLNIWQRKWRRAFREVWSSGKKMTVTLYFQPASLCNELQCKHAFPSLGVWLEAPCIVNNCCGEVDSFDSADILRCSSHWWRPASVSVSQTHRECGSANTFTVCLLGMRTAMRTTQQTSSISCTLKKAGGCLTAGRMCWDTCSRWADFPLYK